MSYNAKKAEAARARGGGGGSGSTTAEIDNIADTVDLQEAHGNDYIQDMMAKKGEAGAEKTAGKKKVPMPSELRWRLLSSNDLQALAALVYSQATPSDTMSKEIQALATVYQNRWDHLQSHPGDISTFGAPNFEGLIFKLQQDMPLHYDPQRMMQFMNAAKFGGDLDDQTDVNTALHATNAATPALAGVNPFPRDYVFVSLDGQSPDPKRTDPSSHIKLGRLHFWAFSQSGKIPPSEKNAEEEKQAEESQARIEATGADEPV